MGVIILLVLVGRIGVMRVGRRVMRMRFMIIWRRSMGDYIGEMTECIAAIKTSRAFKLSV
jgi:hypothetical protein